MAKTAEEIRLEKMAADPNWAKKAQANIKALDTLSPPPPSVVAPQPSIMQKAKSAVTGAAKGMGIGSPAKPSKPKNMDSAALLGLGDNLIDRRKKEIEMAIGEEL